MGGKRRKNRGLTHKRVVEQRKKKKVTEGGENKAREEHLGLHFPSWGKGKHVKEGDGGRETKRHRKKQRQLREGQVLLKEKLKRGRI